MTATTTIAKRSAAEQARLDEGLRAHMLKVYNYLAAGLGLSGLVAWTLYRLATTADPALAALKLKNGVMLTALGKTLYTSSWAWMLCVAPIAIIILMAIAQAWLGVRAAQIGYWTFVSTVGLSLSAIFIVYRLDAIVLVLAATSLAFAALSLWGYVTRRDLSGWGTFLYMGLFCLIVVGIANVFLKSDALTFAKAAAGVLLFSAFTAYDTQQIKDRYVEAAGDAAALATQAVWGAMELFLDFANLLLNLLRLFGSNR